MVKIVSLVRLGDTARDEIQNVDASVELHIAAGWFDGELRESWGDQTADSYLGAAQNVPPRAERDEMLATADVVLGGFPVPVDLVARAPQLRWFHQTPAGASNLRRCDLWGSDVIVTTSRGLGNTLAIAEYVVASFLHFARGLHQASVDQQGGGFDRMSYRPTLLADKTVCVVGAGGIGREVGRLCAALGMRVVGTRRSLGDHPTPGFDHVGGPDDLHALLAESQFVAVCCQWTPDTHGLIGVEAFAAMPEGAVLVNVARGEIIDEDALVAALPRLKGVALDVYIGEFDRSPPDRLWSHPKVVITPHVSAGADVRSRRPIELFCSNLRAFIAGGDLANTIDWTRGY